MTCEEEKGRTEGVGEEREKSGVAGRYGGGDRREATSRVAAASGSR